MPGWHSVSDSFKTPQWTPPPHYLFHSRKPHASSHLNRSVSFCARLNVCPCLPFVPNAWYFNSNHVCMSWLKCLVECNLGEGRHDRGLIGRVGCVRSRFHSPVMCWFVIPAFWQVSLKKAVFIEPDQKFIRQQSILLIQASHSWFTPYLCLPITINEINHSFMLSLLRTAEQAQAKCKSFPAQTLIMSTTALVVLLFYPASQLCTLYMQYSCCIWECLVI